MCEICDLRVQELNKMSQEMIQINGALHSEDDEEEE